MRTTKEDNMKKTYTTPTLMVGDDVVEATLHGFNIGDETANADLYKPEIIGGVGYYL
jgi:hypothetical protein